MAQVAVIGGGAFGTAMACVLARRGHRVRLWAREQEVVESINRERVNALFLRDVPLPDGIVATPEYAVALREAAFVLLVPPAQHMRAVTAQLRPGLPAGVPVVTCSKGLERGSSALMSQVIGETLPDAPLAVLSGPSFAAEISIDRPTGVTLACADPVLGLRLEQEIGGPRFRVYLTDDVVGAQIGGVLKNVLAIACGIVTGMTLGNSMRSMLIARGLAETVDLGLALGARLETFLGLSGIGDIDLSCNSPQSRGTGRAPVGRDADRRDGRPDPQPRQLAGRGNRPAAGVAVRRRAGGRAVAAARHTVGLKRPRFTSLPGGSLDGSRLRLTEVISLACSRTMLEMPGQAQGERRASEANDENRSWILAPVEAR